MYNAAKLPLNLGGINATDINLHIKTTPMSLVRSYLDVKNPAEWDKLAINLIIDYTGLNENILRYKELHTKGPQKLIFPYVNQLFHKLSKV